MIQYIKQELGLSLNRQSFFLALMLLLGVQFYWPPQVIVLFLVPMLVVSVIERVKDKTITYTSFKGVLPLAILFSLYVVTLFFTVHQENANFEIEKKILLLLLPFIAWYSPYTFSSKQLTMVLLGYCIAMLSFFFIVHTQYVFYLLAALKNGEFESLRSYFTSEIFEYNYRIWLGDLWHIHPTYLGAMVNMAILIGVYFVATKTSSKTQKVVGILSIVVGVFFLLLIASRMAFLSLLVAVGIYMFSKIKKHKGIIALGSIIVIVSLFSFLAQTNNRVKEIVNTKIELPTHENFNSVNIRVGIYSCVFDLIAENWLLGVMPGDVQPNLERCYDSKNMQFITERGYNAHNEYLNQLLNFGIIGLGVFVWILAQAFYHAITDKNFMFIGFLVICTMTCFTENMLERFHGILFFTFFYSFFMFLGKNEFAEKSEIE